MADNIKVLNEFLPKAEQARLGAIKIGETLTIDTNEILNVDDSATFKPYLTNCITEIAQNVKLIFNDGTLTLQAGSKLYIPDGFESDGTTPKFTLYTTPSDLNWTSISGGGLNYDASEKLAIQVTSSYEYATTISEQDNKWFSGSAEPVEVSGTMIWYDTANNLIKVKYWDKDTSTHSAWTEKVTIPFGAVQCKNIGTDVPEIITGINAIFNTMSYIGNISFVMPGIVALAPNGKRDDNTLLNIEIAVDKVLVSTETTTTGNMILAITPNGTAAGICYNVSANTYTIATRPPATNRWYNPEVNKFYIYNSNTGLWYEDPQAHIAIVYKNAINSISSFTQKTVFRAADYNETAKDINELQTTKLDASRIQYVSAIPANPQNGVIYLIAQ